MNETPATRYGSQHVFVCTPASLEQLYRSLHPVPTHTRICGAASQISAAALRHKTLHFSTPKYWPSTTPSSGSLCRLWALRQTMARTPQACDRNPVPGLGLQKASTQKPRRYLLPVPVAILAPSLQPPEGSLLCSAETWRTVGNSLGVGNSGKQFVCLLGNVVSHPRRTSVLNQLSFALLRRNVLKDKG